MFSLFFPTGFGKILVKHRSNPAQHWVTFDVSSAPIGNLELLPTGLTSSKNKKKADWSALTVMDRMSVTFQCSQTMFTSSFPDGYVNKIQQSLQLL